MSRKLVAYFSASGVTKRLAEDLAGETGADLFEIVPQVPYEKADLDWTNPRSRSSVEMKDPSCRPPIASDLSGMEAYDTVYLGFPIWWYTAPSIIHTFLERTDFSGKNVVLFATAGSSGFGDTAKDLEKDLPADAHVVESAVYHGHWTKEDLAFVAAKAEA